ncbi:MAG TPA: DoxX family protein [Terriglobales bacterium]|nr:DoxX family protein [Terriglobales bacterium]
MQTGTQTATASKKMLWTGRVISALPVLMLFFGGVMAFLKPPVVLQSMAHFGYPESLVIPLGIVEIVCALIYAIPRTSVFGAVLLTAYFGGATATHVRIGENFAGPVIFAILVWIGLYLREGRLRELAPLRK